MTKFILYIRIILSLFLTTNNTSFPHSLRIGFFPHSLRIWREQMVLWWLRSGTKLPKRRSQHLQCVNKMSHCRPDADSDHSEDDEFTPPHDSTDTIMARHLPLGCNYRNKKEAKNAIRLASVHAFGHGVRIINLLDYLRLSHYFSRTLKTSKKPDQVFPFLGNFPFLYFGLKMAILVHF